MVLITLFSGCNCSSLSAKPDKAFEKQVLEVIEQNPEFIAGIMIKYSKDKQEAEEEKSFQESLDQRQTIKLGESPSLGNKDAKYQLIVFVDLQCPYCRQAETTIDQLQEKYGKNIFLVYKNSPLAFHKEAKPAAKAALAASLQGKFFEYKDQLYKNQLLLGEIMYLEIARDLKLDIKKFNQDRAGDQIQELLEQDVKQAKQLDIAGTPCFFFNGVRVPGAYPLKYFEKVLKSIGSKTTSRS